MVVRFNPCFLTLSQQPHHSAIYFSKKVTLRCSYGMRHMKRGSDLRRPKVIPSVLGNNDGLRVFVVSDLHTDYAENLNWVKCLSTAKVKHKNDVLLVAGDVAETYDMFLVTMSLFKERFEHVFYIPGNHDLWCRREGQKYACKDFYACKWPEGLSNGDMSLALHFDAINDKQMKVIKEIQKTCHHIITFSHFVPRQELCPEKRMLFYPKLPKIIGSDSLEDRIRSIHGAEGRRDATSCHVFGHTHFCWDAVVDGIRYLQAPLAYPRERRRRMNGGENWLPFCLYGENKFADRIKPCFWSDYYSANTRTPHNTELAPWVSRFYKKTESIDL